MLTDVDLRQHLHVDSTSVPSLDVSFVLSSPSELITGEIQEYNMYPSSLLLAVK